VDQVRAAPSPPIAVGPGGGSLAGKLCSPFVGLDHARKLLDHRRAERRQIVGLAARHQPGIHPHRLIHPFSAGVADVRLQTRPRRQRPPRHRIGFHEHPRRMADGSHRLLAEHELPDELHRALIHAQPVRVRHAPGQQQRVVLARPRIAQHTVHRDARPLVVVIHRLDGTVLRRDEVRRRTRRIERLPRLLQLHLLHAVGRQDRDASSRQCPLHENLR
jgi:hypothetical protein